MLVIVVVAITAVEMNKIVTHLKRSKITKSKPNKIAPRLSTNKLQKIRRENIYNVRRRGNYRYQGIKKIHQN